MVAFSTPNCRERNGCKPWLNIHHYMTNSIQLPSILGSGFMNPANYVKFGEPQTTNTITTHTFILNFTLPSSSTGFYIAAQDPGGCITLSRMRVYRENCKARQIGLALYPSAPAPVSGTQAVKFSCVPNAGIIGTETVGCTIEGKWADDSAQCGCLPGYQINTETYTCESKPLTQALSSFLCVKIGSLAADYGRCLTTMQRVQEIAHERDHMIIT